MRRPVARLLGLSVLCLAASVAFAVPGEGGLTEGQRAELKARIATLREKAAAADQAGRETEARNLRKEAEAIAAKLEGGGDRPAQPKDLRRAAEELREKAQLLREKGSVGDAEFLERKAGRLDEAQALRDRSNELERRGKEARDAGRADEAAELLEESGRAWRRSEELLAADAPKAKDAPRGERGPDDLRRRLEHLRTAEKNAREGGMPDVADRIAKEAAETERALREREGGGGDSGAEAENRRLREELEALRRRVRELEEEIQRLRAR